MTAKKINPEGTLLGFGASVRLERGFAVNADGHIAPDERGDPPEPQWILFKKVDVADDETTTYTYRFDEVGRFKETDPGEVPAEAVDAAEALAKEA